MNGKEVFTIARDVERPHIVEHVDFNGLLHEVGNPRADYWQTIERIRMIARRLAEEGVAPERIKANIKPLKLTLPVFVTYEAGRLGGEALSASNLLQIDVDFPIVKGNHMNAQYCKDTMIAMGCFSLVTLSPSGFGVKAFIRAGGDIGLIRSRLASYLEKANVKGDFKIDPLGRRSHCFMPFDPALYFSYSDRVYQYGEAPKQSTPPVSKNPAPISNNLGVSEYACRKAFNIARYNQGGNILTHEGKREYSYLCYVYGLECGEAWDYFTTKVAPDINEAEFSRRWQALSSNITAKHRKGSLANDIAREYEDMLKRQAEYKPN